MRETQTCCLIHSEKRKESLVKKNKLHLGGHWKTERWKRKSFREISFGNVRGNLVGGQGVSVK